MILFSSKFIVFISFLSNEFFHSVSDELQTFSHFLNDEDQTRLILCFGSRTEFNETEETIRKQNSYTNIYGSQYTEEDFATRPTRVLIHGWKNSLSSKSSFSQFSWLEREYKVKFKDLNIVIVKWNRQSLLYHNARGYAPFVGETIAKYLDEKLGKNEYAWSNLKIIGHSLGAHIAGFVGKKVSQGRVGSIIGLDPAGPAYEGREAIYRLDKDDAEYVECIYTGRNCYGINENICDANFYPNSGSRQPGCGAIGFQDFDCDHSRAHILFTESLNENRFRALKCDGPLRTCLVSSIYMGGEPGNKDKDVDGIFYLETNKRWPFGRG